MNTTSSFSQRFIIGLTGNIGTGKSLIRNMLQHLGAFGIDADALSRQVLLKNTLVQRKISDRFGQSLITTKGEIDRAVLAEIVFDDKESLIDLENILHPYICNATQNLIDRSQLPIIVIEAIKLFESDLAGMCDSIWVVDTDETIIFSRLESQRRMNRDQILKRLSHQSPSEVKKVQADVIIDNGGDVFSTWKQVESNWILLKGTERKFSQAENITPEKMTFVKDYLVKPGSYRFQDFQKSIQTDANLTWLPTRLNILPPRNNWSIDNAAHIASKYFVFPNENVKENPPFTIWELSQFDIVLVGYNHPAFSIRNGNLSNILARIEEFSRLHIIEKIILPGDRYLQERKSSLIELGFRDVPLSDDKFPCWNKAGYNLLQKILCSGNDLFAKTYDY